MKYIIAVLSVCLAIAACQGQSRPPPPPGSQKPLTMAVPATPQSSPPARPTRPKGCSPGCGPTEICAELGQSYCRGTTVCSVCIKMSSIRFPASALAGMFSQQQQQQQKQQQPQAVVPVQQIPVQPAPANPLESNATLPVYGNEPTKNGTGAGEVSIMELASRQRRIQDKLSNDFGIQGPKGLPPRPPPVDDNITVRPVNHLRPVIKPINDARTLPTANPFGKMATDVKYPIVATIHEPTQHIHEAPVTLDQTHLDQIHQQYQQGNVVSTLTPKEKTAAEFDFASFKRYQAWLKQQKVSVDQSTSEDFALFQKYRKWAKLQEQPASNLNPSVSATEIAPLVPSPTNTPDHASNSAKTLPPFDYAAFKQQWQQEVAPRQGATGTVTSPTTQPSTGPDSNYLDYATIQRMWQQQQQQQQQQQLNQVYQVQPNPPSYVPQPAVNNFNNDPFDIFGFNDPMPQQQNHLQNNIQGPIDNNNMFGLMMFEGLGFGGGFGLGF